MIGESLDVFPAGPDGDWGIGPADSDIEIVELYRHEILDAARELLEGTQWLVMDQDNGDNE